MRIPWRRVALFGTPVAIAIALVLVFGGRSKAAPFVTATVDRGDIEDVVGATGTLQAVTTVQVGSQVSGTVQSLEVDFNSRVSKGQVVARLDPSLLEARLSQARANLVAARANVERARATVADTKQKYERAKELAAESLLPQADLETAQSNYQGAVAGVRGAEAAVSQAAASVTQAQVDVAHTIIRAPIDGVVVARNVDVGQTVAASLQAPVLFVIANDLSRMQVNASIDEADIGRVRVGQDVTFRVDAHPNETFTGRVEQVRLQPVTVQNVVTYNTLISVDNSGQRLMPGMTATVSVIVRQRDDVLRIPAAALRFRPEGYQATRAPREGPAASPAAAQPSATPTAAPRVSESPAVGGSRGNGGGTGRGRRRGREGGGAEGGSRSYPAATGDLPGSRPATVFVPGADGRPQARPIRVGISDGQFVEVAQGLAEGEKIITGVQSTDAAARPAAGSSPANPFQPARPQRRQR
jgi:HlyD family secretion protein